MKLLDRIQVRSVIDSEAHPLFEDLQRLLSEFYDTHTEYFSQAAQNNHSSYYDLYLPIIDELIQSNPERRIRVLEVGAGRSSFPRWLEEKQRRAQVEVTLQDITPSNESWLLENADHVIVCDATAQIPGGPYDLIFCTFVYEHLIRPDRFLENAMAALKSGGVLIITAPRYDFPGYTPPALRRHSRLDRLVWNAALAVRKSRQVLSGRPQFWIATKPAVLNGPFYRDADAVHLVSKTDIRMALRTVATEIPLRAPERRSIYRALGPLMLLHVAFRKH